jgi:prepilin-type N-terminal cleavage/methylation domain-containing protein
MRQGFTLVELVAVMTIMALALALVLPVLSGLSSGNTTRAAAGKLANLLNRRIAMARSGGGPMEFALSGESKVIAVIPEEAGSGTSAPASNGIVGDSKTLGSGANSVLGHDILSPSPATAQNTDLSEDNAVEVLDLGDVKIDALYVKTAVTGETKDTLCVTPGACDEGLFVLSSGSSKACVSVRGLAGRARVYDSVPTYLAEFFEVPQDATTLGK